MRHPRKTPYSIAVPATFQFPLAGIAQSVCSHPITDIFIAATGVRHGWTVVTNNSRDFSRIHGLVLEDWR